MRAQTPPFETDELLAQSRWVRALALRLVADPDQADDLAQDVCLAALRHRPAGGRSLRGWLTAVLRNRVRERVRATHRRAERERLAAPREASVSTLELVERLAAHRELVDAVMELREPYREVVLRRFFSDQRPARIASELGVPVSTVKTRLDRALKQLRARYEARRGGDGRSWAMALVPLLPPTGRAPVAALGALLVTTPLKLVSVGAAAAAAIGLLLYWGGDASPDDATPAAAGPQRDPGAPARVDAPAVGPAPRRAEVAVQDTGEDGEWVAPAAVEEAASAEPLVGRVFDVEGRPAPGVALVFRPSGGDAAGRAETRSSGDGTFHFADAVGRGRIASADAELVTVITGVAGAERGDVLPVVVVARRHPLAGRVGDTVGRPLPGAAVTLAMPEGFMARFPVPLDRAWPTPYRVASDDAGRFSLEDAPFVPGARLAVSLEGYVPFAGPLPAYPDPALDVVLHRVALEADTLRGIVVDRDGAAVAGARVALGMEVTRADELGEFRFDLARPQELNDLAERMTGRRLLRLMAIHAGFQPARLDVEVAEDGSPRWPEYLVLELGDPPLTISGRVVDPEGEPLPGVDVWIADATVFAMREAYRYVLTEGVLAEREGERHLVVATDGDGRFTLNGLVDRTYEVVAADPSTMVQTRPQRVAAGRGDVELVLDGSEVHELVAGRVVTRAGAPVAGVWVTAKNDAYRLSLEGRPVSTSHRAMESVVTGEDGSFEIVGVPRYLAYLRCSGDRIVTRDFGRDEQGLGEVGRGDLESLELVVALRARLRVELASEDFADEVAVLDPEGREVTIRVITGRSSFDSERIEVVGGRTEIMTVQDDAATLVLFRAGDEVERVPLTLVGDDVLVVRP